MHRLLAATVASALVITGCTATTAAPRPAEEAETPAASTETATARTEAPTAGTETPPARTEPAPPFKIVAGGGTNPLPEKALDAKNEGAVWDLEFAPDGTANLLINTEGKLRLQRIRPDGTLTKVELGYGQSVGNRIAVGPDGSAYVNQHAVLQRPVHPRPASDSPRSPR